MSKKLLFYVVCLLSIVVINSCNKNQLLQGYSRNTEGFYYKLYTIGDGNKTEHSNDVLIFDASFFTQTDSLFLDTKHDLPNGVFLPLSNFKNNPQLKLYLSSITEGDSLSLMLNPKQFFNCFFDTIAPYFCANDTLVIAHLKLNQIISFAEYTDNYLNSKDYKEIDEDKELEELQEIDKYLKLKNSKVNADNYGIYILEKKTTNLPKVEAGKLVTIELNGQFIDGKPITSKSQFLTFVYGTPDQVVKGLNIVIGSLKMGEYVKIILPSRLAFGEKGSSNGTIPPYTPLIYELKIIDIK